MRKIKKRIGRMLAGILSAGMVLGNIGVPEAIAAVPKTGESFRESSFVKGFEEPDGDAKTFIRWWITPSMSNEADVRNDIRAIKEVGYGGIELVDIMGKYMGGGFGDNSWNKCMKWALDEAVKQGLQLDFTMGPAWPITTPAINDPDDELSEQGLFSANKDCTVAAEGDTVSISGLPLPRYRNADGQYSDFDTDRDYELVAVTAAKKNGNSYDIGSAKDITSSVSLNERTVSGSSVLWQAPEAGEWGIFFMYRQGLSAVNNTKPVIDHFSREATDKATEYWDKTLMGDRELRKLYKKNGGNIFCDSLELGNKDRSNAAFWTKDLLKEFKERRGYDLTPFLPVIFIDDFYSYYGHKNGVDTDPVYDFGVKGRKIRQDFYQTLTELFTENHVEAISDWAKSHNMKCRYQVYGAAMNMTLPTIAADIVENESWGSEDTIDEYRMQSGVVHTGDNGIYSIEAAAVIGLGWAQTWGGSYLTGEDKKNYWNTNADNYVYKGKHGKNEDAGFLYHMNRAMAAGVNRAVMHGFSGRLSFMDGAWPGMSAMAMGGFPNEWGDRTPMWAHAKEMLSYMNRAQYIMQQGQADIDLAVYRQTYYDEGHDWGLNSLEKAGYTYDFAAADFIRQDKIKADKQDGRTVINADGPSYKALVLDHRNLVGEGTEIKGQTASDMPVDVAEKILSMAKEGLPVVIVGDAPSDTGEYLGDDDRLNVIMNELAGLENTAAVDSKDGVPGALKTLGVEPDVKKDVSPLLNFHRTDDENEYYYLYNSDLNSTLSQNVSLKGEGVPYILDPWNGTVKKSGEYRIENGYVSIDTELKPNENCFIAIAKEDNTEYVTDSAAEEVFYDSEGRLRAKTGQGGMNSFNINDGSVRTVDAGTIANESAVKDWDVSLEEWKGEGRSMTPVKTRIDAVHIEGDPVPWNTLEGFDKKTGIATYSSSFSFDGDPANGDGAYLGFDYVSDTMKVSLNGMVLSGVNQLSKKIDIGSYIRKGNNELSIEITAGNSNNKGDAARDYGIDGEVLLQPYKVIPVEEKAEEVKEEENNSNAPKEGRLAAAETTEPVQIGGVKYQVSYNETMLTYTGASLKKTLAQALVFTDENGSRKDIKSVSAKIRNAGEAVITKVVFTDGTKLKKPGIKVKVAPREVSANSAKNKKDAVVYASLKDYKLNKSGKKLALRLNMPNWKKDAKDVSEESLDPKKPFMIKKAGKKDFDFTDNGETITIYFKNNLQGSLTVPKN